MDGVAYTENTCAVTMRRIRVRLVSNSSYNRAPLQVDAQMRAIAQAQPNIALIKYWGKRDIERNLPAVGSLSLTLSSLWTKMEVVFSADFEKDVMLVNDDEADDMLPRVVRCLNRIAGEKRPVVSVESHCNFPIAAGLASSASAFAALVVAAH